MSENINVYFDKEYKIRVLDPAKYEKSEELEKECGVFVEKVSTFNDKVKDLVTIIEQYAAKIDYHKYNAIGLSMAADKEKKNCETEKKAIQHLINEKKIELERYIAQLQSLERIEAEQKSMIDRITSSRS